MSQAVRRLALIARAAFLALAVGAFASPVAGAAPVTAEDLQAAFPGAERAGEAEGTPATAPVYEDGAVAGYVASTWAAVGSTGYSGKPLDVLVGVSKDAVVTGAALVSHSEPILVIGVSEEQLARYVMGFRGFDLKAGAATGTHAAFPDAISGATVSSAVIRDAIVRAGRAVARSRGLIAEPAAAERLDRESVSEASWPGLLADGSIASGGSRKTGKRMTAMISSSRSTRPC